MEFSILDKADSLVIAAVQFILMLFFIFMGIKTSYYRKISIEDYESNSLLVTGIYTILGLLLAFSFGMAGNRFDSRKKDIIEESNCIGTAILRSDMYPDSIGALFREDFRKYLETRIEYFEAHTDIERMKRSIEGSDIFAEKLWKRASELSRNGEYLAVTNQMIPALNSMFDIANTRLHGELYKLPNPIVIMLLISLLIAAFVFGYSSHAKGKVDWYLAYCFCLVSVLLLYFILDLDRPRRGLINLDDSQMAITNIRKMFK